MIEVLKKEISREAEAIIAKGTLPSLSFQDYQAFSQTGNRLHFEARYFERRRQLATVALAYVSDRQPSIKEALENLIWEICNEYSWSLPAHFEEAQGTFVAESQVTIDLFAAETGQSLAEIAELFGESLALPVLRRIKLEVARRLFEPLHQRKWPWEGMANNWSGVVGGCIGLAALAILPFDSEEQHAILSRLESTFQTYLDSFDEDGACLEGVGYWAYGFGYYLYFAEKYCEVYDERYLNFQKVQAIAAFPKGALISQQEFVPFSDANQVTLPSGLLSYCWRRFKVPVPAFQRASPLDFDPCYRWAHLYRNLTWTQEVPVENAQADYHYFADAQWLIQRQSENQFVFAAKGGSNQESHNHNDVGHFIIGDGDQLWLTDLGAGEYTKDYFKEETRYDLLVNRSLGHSVPVINGYEQRPGPYGASGVSFEAVGARLVFSLDLREVYPPAAGLQNFTRSFEVVGEMGQVTVRDQLTVKSRAEQVIVQNLVSDIEPQLTAAGVVWEGARYELWLAPVAGEISCRQETYKNHQGQEKVAYLLQIKQSFVSDYDQGMQFRKKLKEKVAVKK